MSQKRLLRAKVVLLGAPAVGKTSLVRRYVHSLFSDDYKSTIGVKVDRKSVELSDATVNLLLWDVHGETEGLEVPASFLRASSAALMVLDASRPETAQMAGDLARRFLEASPEAAVFPVANKSDLDVDWPGVEEAAAAAEIVSPTRLSAKNGDGVEAFFAGIATQLARTRPSASS